MTSRQISKLRRYYRILKRIDSIRLESLALEKLSDLPFNRQEIRRQLFEDLFQAIGFRCIVETGTWIGNTTQYFAGFGVPVYSCELNEFFHKWSGFRLEAHDNIRLFFASSDEFLDDWPIADGEGPLFFYLDAHWNENLPLRGEISAIGREAPHALVMIDDFQVPGDDGFGYDDYGTNGHLTLSYIRDQIAGRFSVFFPAYSSADESGAKRGCVILSNSADIDAVLAKSRYLRRHDLDGR